MTVWYAGRNEFQSDITKCRIDTVISLEDENIFFYVLLTAHLSIFILAINQLDAQNLFFSKFISCLYMFRVNVFIIRRSKLYYTASGIIIPIGGRLVHRLREGPPTGVMIPEAV